MYVAPPELETARIAELPRPRLANPRPHGLGVVPLVVCVADEQELATEACGDRDGRVDALLRRDAPGM
jgi:hypothetical protein